jgi:hypothetical protein
LFSRLCSQGFAHRAPLTAPAPQSERTEFPEREVIVLMHECPLWVRDECSYFPLNNASLSHAPARPSDVASVQVEIMVLESVPLMVCWMSGESEFHPPSPLPSSPQLTAPPGLTSHTNSTHTAARRDRMREAANTAAASCVAAACMAWSVGPTNDAGANAEHAASGVGTGQTTTTAGFDESMDMRKYKRGRLSLPHQASPSVCCRWELKGVGSRSWRSTRSLNNLPTVPRP